MVIRTGKLWRICRKCDGYFEPEGKFHKICNKCSTQKWMEDWYRLSQKVQNESVVSNQTPQIKPETALESKKAQNKYKSHKHYKK